MLNAEVGVGCGSGTPACGGSGDCPAPPDLCIKRHDTRPALKISMSDCDGPVDLSTAVAVEASMWFDAKLKSSISDTDTSLRFADDIGFDSVAVGDVISTSGSRSPELMLVSSVDESAKTVVVSRGHSGTEPRDWPKGASLSAFRFVDQAAQVESVYEDVESLEGTVSEELVDTLLVFEFSAEHTSVPGCYWVEFKIMGLDESGGVEWTKRVPLSAKGFMVRVVDSPTSST